MKNKKNPRISAVIARLALPGFLIVLVLVPILLITSTIANKEDEHFPDFIVHYPGNGIVEETGVSEKLTAYMAQNEDVVGLIRIPGTLLENAVVQSEPEDYYMRRDLNKEYFIGGTPFVEADTQIGAAGGNIIVYGHNMEDRSIFGTLMDYKEFDFLLQHPYIEFESRYGMQYYQIFSVFYCDVRGFGGSGFDFYKYTDLTVNDHTEFMRQARNRSIYSIPITADAEDYYITLSTCTYEIRDHGRLVVIGKAVGSLEDIDLDLYSITENPVHPDSFKGRINPP